MGVHNFVTSQSLVLSEETCPMLIQSLGENWLCPAAVYWDEKNLQSSQC